VQSASGNDELPLTAASGVHRVRVTVVGNVHAAWLDGEQQISVTDASSPITAGTAIAFVAGGGAAGAFEVAHFRA
jgi:hypothetical protein